MANELCVGNAKKYYVRHLTAMYREAGPNGQYHTSDVYEVYTQPRLMYLRARLYHVWDQVLWKSGVEKVHDRIWERFRAGRNDEEIWEKPSTRHDMRCYYLDVKGQIVLGRVEVERK